MAIRSLVFFLIAPEKGHLLDINFHIEIYIKKEQCKHIIWRYWGKYKKRPNLLPENRFQEWEKGEAGNDALVTSNKNFTLTLLSYVHTLPLFKIIYKLYINDISGSKN